MNAIVILTSYVKLFINKNKMLCKATALFWRFVNPTCYCGGAKKVGDAGQPKQNWNNNKINGYDLGVSAKWGNH